MKHILFTLFSLSLVLGLKAQQFNCDAFHPTAEYSNIHFQQLLSTEDATSFMIWVKSHVNAHRHNYHTEHVYIVEGSGLMLFESDTFRINAGDFIAIPPKTIHGVKNTGTVPLKALSIQSPKFIGEDREFVPIPGWSED